jgi:hypothetical protein
MHHAQAMDAIAAAWEALHRGDLAGARELAERALALWPESSDAMLLLGLSETVLPRRRELCARAVDLAASRAARSSLMPGRFGADSAGLACLRAMAALGRCEWALGNNAEALALGYEVVALDAADPLRFVPEVVSWLVEDGQLEPARGLAVMHHREGGLWGSFWPYARALIAFAWSGADGESPDRWLRHALELDPATGRALLGAAARSVDAPRAVAEALGSAWSAVPGAAEWLAGALEGEAAAAARHADDGLVREIVRAAPRVGVPAAREIARRLRATGWVEEADPVLVVGGLSAAELHLDTYFLFHASLDTPKPRDDSPAGLLMAAGAPLLAQRSEGPYTRLTLAPTVRQALAAVARIKDAEPERLVQGWLRRAGYGAGLEARFAQLAEEWRSTAGRPPAALPLFGPPPRDPSRWN